MPVPFSARRERFRAHLAAETCLVPASIHDPLTARIAEELGFEIGMLGGSTASLTVLGAPDLILLTLSELAEQCRRISRASALPFMVDADHGYGNALNVERTVVELEAAGVAALTIEDTALPRGFGQGEAAQLLTVEEGVGKMRAALAGRSDPALVVVGRTSAARLSSLDDALARARAYEAAGVDALFLLGLDTVEALERAADAVSVPLIVEGPIWQEAGAERRARLGVRICLRGHPTIRAEVQAAWDTLSAVRAGAGVKDLPGLAPPELMDRLTRRADYAKRIRAWLDADAD